MDTADKIVMIACLICVAAMAVNELLNYLGIIGG